jgi:hypothetical protein
MIMEKTLKDLLDNNWVRPCREVIPEDVLSDQALFEATLLYCAGTGLAKIGKDRDGVLRWKATEGLARERLHIPQWLFDHVQQANLVLQPDIAQSLQIISDFIKIHGARDCHALVSWRPSYVCPVLLQLAGEGEAGLAIDGDSHRWLPSPKLLLYYERRHSNLTDAIIIQESEQASSLNEAIGRLRIIEPLSTIVGDWCCLRMRDRLCKPIEVEAAEFLIMSEQEGVAEPRCDSHGRLTWGASKRTVKLLKKNRARVGK